MKAQVVQVQVGEDWIHGGSFVQNHLIIREPSKTTLAVWAHKGSLFVREITSQKEGETIPESIGEVEVSESMVEELRQHLRVEEFLLQRVQELIPTPEAVASS